MTCATPDALQLRFERSGIIVEPYEFDIRSESRHYSHGTFRMSEEAGRVVGKRARLEPITIVIGGHPARRMFAPEEAVEFHQGLEQEEYAEVELYDARKILEYGTFDRSYEEFNIAGVVEDILSAREDPSSVIQSYRFVDAGDVESTRQSLGAVLFGTPSLSDLQAGPQTRETPDGLLSQPRHAAGGMLDYLPGVGDINSAISFDQVTPAQAMTKLLDQQELEWWVDADGVLNIGIDGTYGRLVGVAGGAGNIAVKRYNVTEEYKKTSSVNVRGPYYARDAPERERDLYVLAEASTSAYDGDTITVDWTHVQEPKELEAVAVRRLYRELRADVDGSLVINGMASRETATVGAIRVGDYITVDDSMNAVCNEGVATGTFQVDSVHHRAGVNRGWDTTLEISRVPAPGTLTTKSVYYSPMTDKRYDSLEAYQRDKNEAESQDRDGAFRSSAEFAADNANE
jgi:hypothetical protein